jgi:hypothetical protein
VGYNGTRRTARCSFLLRLGRGARPHLSPFSPSPDPTIAPARSCASVILVSLPLPFANEVDVGAARCRGLRREVGRDLCGWRHQHRACVRLGGTGTHPEGPALDAPRETMPAPPARSSSAPPFTSARERAFADALALSSRSWRCAVGSPPSPSSSPSLESSLESSAPWLEWGGSETRVEVKVEMDSSEPSPGFVVGLTGAMVTSYRWSCPVSCPVAVVDRGKRRQADERAQLFFVALVFVRRLSRSFTTRLLCSTLSTARDGQEEVRTSFQGFERRGDRYQVHLQSKGI